MLLIKRKYSLNKYVQIISNRVLCYQPQLFILFFLQMHRVGSGWNNLQMRNIHIAQTTSLLFVHRFTVRDEKGLRRSISSFSTFELFLCKRGNSLAAWMIALRRCKSSRCKCTLHCISLLLLKLRLLRKQLALVMVQILRLCRKRNTVLDQSALP